MEVGAIINVIVVIEAKDTIATGGVLVVTVA